MNSKGRKVDVLREFICLFQKLSSLLLPTAEGFLASTCKAVSSSSFRSIANSGFFLRISNAISIRKRMRKMNNFWVDELVFKENLT